MKSLEVQNKSEQQEEIGKKEVPAIQESPEELKQKSEKEVINIKENGLLQAERMANEAGLGVDKETRDQLIGINQEAEGAKEEFLQGISHESKGDGANLDKPKSESEIDHTHREIKEEREDAEKMLEVARKELEQMLQKIEKLEEQIESYKAGFISKLLNRKNIRQAESDIESVKMDVRFSEDRIERAKNLMATYDSIIATQDDLNEAKNEKEDIKTRNHLEMSEREKESQVRDLSGIMKDKNCYFVHDMVDANWKPDANNKTLDTRQLSLEDQLDIVAGLNPTISASTLRPDTNDWTFGKKRRIWSFSKWRQSAWRRR
jgi:hypothetical protein